MANLCTTCSCIPYINRCSCPPKRGISILMPQCQIIPDQATPVNNPCFDGGFSYWSYKIFVDCSSAEGSNSVDSIAFPICQNIVENQVVLMERIDGCMNFEEKAFEIIPAGTTNTEFGIAPVGFQYLKTRIDNRYTNGVCVEYQIQLSGNYPEKMQEIKVKTVTDEVLSFCGDCFIVPGCAGPSELQIMKECERSILEEGAAIKYKVQVKNVGESPAKAVLYSSVLSYDSTNMSIEDVEIVSAPTSEFTVNRHPSLIEVTTNLGSINPGEEITINECYFVNNFLEGGNYVFTNLTTVIGEGQRIQETCTGLLSVAKVRVSTAFLISNENSINFRLEAFTLGASPQTEINLQDQVIIPQGLAVKFTNLDGGRASVAEEVEVIGPTVVSIDYSRLPLSAGKGATKNIELEVVSVSSIGIPLTITNTVTEVKYSEDDSQVLLNPEIVSATREVKVISSIQ